MKKISILALAMILTAAVFAGCRNRNTPAATAPSTTVAPTTHATTEPTHTTATEPGVHESTGNGTHESGVTEGTGAAEGRARQNVPGAY